MSEQATENIGRPLYDHKNNKFNRDCIAVTTADVRQSDNANHAYKIAVYPAFDENGCREPDVAPITEVTLQFQNGGLKDVGPNGITDQALLAIVLDRLRGFNDGPFRSRENSVMITKIEEALMWGEKRGNDRSRRGVEGERIA